MFSVIIPTYKRLNDVQRCLRSLQEQSVDDFEILLVDNAGDRKLRRWVKDFNFDAPKRVQYLHEPQLGVHHARHLGAHNARGKLLVFTDDDATFEPDWLERYVKAFSGHPEMVAAGGPVLPKWQTKPPSWVIDYVEKVNWISILSLLKPKDSLEISSRGFFYSINMAIRRQVFFEVGGFNPDIFGEVWLGDNEVGLVTKLREKNLLVGHVPDAVVYHHIPSHRMTLAYFRQRMANEGNAESYSRYHKGVPGRFFLVTDVVQLSAKNSICWAKAAVLRGRTDLHSLLIQLRAAMSMAQAKYTTRLIFDRKLKRLVLKRDWLNEPIHAC